MINKYLKMKETSVNDDSNPRSTRNKGPHGLGDPEDTYLRKVETEVLIPKLIRERTRAEKCNEEVAAFSKCGKENGLSVIFKCRKENELLQMCLTNWWNNEEFREDCKKQYLHDRSEFRRTGIPVQSKRIGH